MPWFLALVTLHSCDCFQVLICHHLLSGVTWLLLHTTSDLLTQSVNLPMIHHSFLLSFILKLYLCQEIWVLRNGTNWTQSITAMSSGVYILLIFVSVTSTDLDIQEHVENCTLQMGEVMDNILLSTSDSLYMLFPFPRWIFPFLWNTKLLVEILTSTWLMNTIWGSLL